MHSIFNYFLTRPEDSPKDASTRIAYSAWFVDSFPITEFEKEEYILYRMLEYSVRLEVPLKEKYFRTFLDSHLKEIVIKDNIRVSGTVNFTNTDDLVQMSTLVATTKEVMMGCYWELLGHVGSLDEFVADADRFMTERLDERALQVMSTAYELRNTQKNGMVGVVDSIEMLREDTSMLLEIYDKDKLEELVSATSEDERQLEFITDSGIPGIDNDTLGGHRGQLFGIEAAPGIGKTRFALGVWTYRAAVTHKRNVLFYALEQSRAEIEAMLVARHIYTLYRLEIDAKLILFKKVPDEYKDKVTAARMDLFESGKYGKIYIKAGVTLYYEDFVEKIKMLDKLKGPFDVVIIDYMGLFEQKPVTGRQSYRKSLDEYEIIKRAYRKFKKYVLNYLKFGIAVNQLNREGAQKSKKDIDIETTDAQGGMEVYRSTDYNMTLTATPAMEAKGLRRVSSPKKRASEGIGNLLLKTRLACCLWMQNDSNVI